jgi:4-hydroxybenzoate polyprenyltransferase
LISKIIRDTVNLLIYGGFFIGLCASCITALTLEANGNVDANLGYITWIGLATAALYCGHRVIGLHKVAHIKTSERFNVIRQYRTHIWIYFIVWSVLTIALFFKYISFELLFWLLPGAIIGVGYVLPFLSDKKRLRDLGWTKIIMIGWSWAWLTAFIPAYIVADEPLQLAIFQGIERFLFIIAITIPFEIRDIAVDKSIGLVTMPEKLGRKRTLIIGWVLVFFFLVLSFITGFHYYNIPYAVTAFFIAIFTLVIIHISHRQRDDYFFGGLTDGLMIIALLLYTTLSFVL